MARNPDKQPRLFSKALFKQSYKANYMMWLIVTFAVCFTLASVMVISGGSGIGKIKDSVQETIVQGVVESNIKKSGIGTCDGINTALIKFDEEYVAKFDQENTYDNFVTFASTPEEERAAKFQELYVVPSFNAGYAAVRAMYPPINESEENPLFQATMVAINPTAETKAVYDDYYNRPEENRFKETAPSEAFVAQFFTSMQTDVMNWQSNNAAGTSTDTFLKSNDRLMYRDHRAYYATAMLVAIEFFKPETLEEFLILLQDYGITAEDFADMGFTLEKVHRLAYEAGVDFDEKCYYEYKKIPYPVDSPEYIAEKQRIHDDLAYEIGGSLLDKMPENVAQGLKEIGSLDIYSLLICSVFFKMAGLLLPIIYVIMVSNNLIAGQVDTGSMAYVLSTSTRRKQVTFTQGLFLLSSLVAMFACAAITGLICLPMVTVTTGLTAGKLMLSVLNSFMIMFAIAGINYFTSCIYDRSRRAMAIGGGISMFFLVATMLGLFGSPVIPSVIRIDALNYFNYVSLMSLFDVISVLEGGFAWIWKVSILFIGGCTCFFLGARRFHKKDLPL